MDVREGTPAPDFPLRRGAEEREIRFAELGGEGPLVAIFLRHFG